MLQTYQINVYYIWFGHCSYNLSNSEDILYMDIDRYVVRVKKTGKSRDKAVGEGESGKMRYGIQFKYGTK